LSLEKHFDPVFTTTLALREKQIQQNYRPIIGIHKWFARRPGTVFRSLLLSEFNGSEPIRSSFWRSHRFQGVIADPFMGGGTTIYEANRLGFHVVGADINPMAYWIVRQSLAKLDIDGFTHAANEVISYIESQIGDLYRTYCIECGELAQVKYFIWVKTEACPCCGCSNDLFPGYLLAEATRHPKHVLICGLCGALNEYDKQPTTKHPESCQECGHQVHKEGPAQRRRMICRQCETVYPFPMNAHVHPPEHRMIAMEYYCKRCKPNHRGRFFKRPDKDDQARFQQAQSLLSTSPELLIPDDQIPAGDETGRLHRWGYHRYRDMFNERQLVGLSFLLSRIREVEEKEPRHALLTVFSDFLRYQNMLCRYDTYALKCQGIFSVHGFPVGLIQCENNLLGIPKIGSGSFRHFIEKYTRGKLYCQAPFETVQNGARSKRIVFVEGESIEAKLVNYLPSGDEREAYILAVPASIVELPKASLDGVFTDPPYFDNVQYAELMDFCFSWLRLGLQEDVSEFLKTTTRSQEELTGNVTLGRGIEHFTSGLSKVFCHYAASLKPGAPFVFTYHHNKPLAYIPLVVAILDAKMDCSLSLPVAAEMSASLHILATVSSVVDSVLVCRVGSVKRSSQNVQELLVKDALAMQGAGLVISEGDIRCLAAGHIARIAVNSLYNTWDNQLTLADRMSRAKEVLDQIANEVNLDSVHALISDITNRSEKQGESIFDSAI
jgi:adenine-specific DNA methylase